MRTLNKFRRWYIETYNDTWGADGKAFMIVVTSMILVVVLFVSLMIIANPVLWVPTIVIGLVLWGFFYWVFNEEEKN